jgi:peptide deformylase
VSAAKVHFDKFIAGLMLGRPVEVLEAPHPILRMVASHVEPTDLHEAKVLSQAMREALVRSGLGVALAASQVGVPVRMFVIKKQLAEKANVDHTMINPQWAPIGERCDVKEGCLSFGPAVATKKRYQAVEVTYTDLRGNKKTKVVQNLIAQIVQHECEHLSGILLTDNL